MADWTRRLLRRRSLPARRPIAMRTRFRWVPVGAFLTGNPSAHRTACPHPVPRRTGRGSAWSGRGSGPRGASASGAPSPAPELFNRRQPRGRHRRSSPRLKASAAPTASRGFRNRSRRHLARTCGVARGTLQIHDTRPGTPRASVLRSCSVVRKVSRTCKRPAGSERQRRQRQTLRWPGDVTESRTSVLRCRDFAIPGRSGARA